MQAQLSPLMEPLVVSKRRSLGLMLEWTVKGTGDERNGVKNEKMAGEE